MENNNYKKYQEKTDTEQDRRLTTVEHHIRNTNQEMGDIKSDIAGMKKDILWLKWGMRFMVTTQVAVFLTLLKLLFK